MDVTTPEVVGAIALAAAGAAAAAAWAVRRRRAVPPAAEAVADDRIAPRPAGIRAALAATGRRFRERLDAATGGARGALFDALEEALLAADVGARTTAAILERVRDETGGGADPAELRRALRLELLRLLGSGAPGAIGQTPWVVLVTGVNGVGKTTTIGKLAAMHRAAGRSVLVVAADTFRAAAIDQLAVWAERTGADIVRHGQGADPSAVVFDGLRAARARGADVVLIDTAGRLHTRTPLMDELAKVRRTVDREIPGAPHEVLLVLDATTGQNALNQARAFVDAAGVTGVVVTKLDGTAKGGVVVAVGQDLGIPVRYVGVGEGVDDLRPFDAAEFVAGLVGAE
jgi:fused signal recognition particle receptor